MAEQAQNSGYRMIGVAGLLVAWAVAMAAAVVIGAADYDDLAGVRGRFYASMTVAGRCAGLMAIVLVLMQYVLSARFRFLDCAVGLGRLLKCHAVLGVTALVFAGVHPLLVYTDPVNKPGAMRWGLWPEALGAVALTVLVIVVVTSVGRGFLNLPYSVWRKVHYLVFAAAGIGAVHMFAKGYSVRGGAGLVFVAVMIAVYTGIFWWVKIMKPQSLREHPFVVSEVRPVNHNCVEVVLRAPAGIVFNHQPGQYAFLRFVESAAPNEEHPFTISSPGVGGVVRFTIKKCGDFTNQIDQVKGGDLAVVDGPYGRFSYAFSPKAKCLLFIAGGIGVTPMLSMLRRLAAAKDRRPVTLIWANRTAGDLLFSDELAAIGGDLPNFRRCYLFSREAAGGHYFGHPDLSYLKATLNENDLAAEVFVCGPPAMMASVAQSLNNLKFPGRRVHSELFSL